MFAGHRPGELRFGWRRSASLLQRSGPAGLHPSAVTYMNGQGKPMPPAPATKLTDWEIDVITAWSKEMPPAP
jgi:hypothetical protein